jgi:hypothetical protein
MNFVCAMLLRHMPEVDAFDCFCALMEGCPLELAGLFSPGLPKLNLCVFQLQVGLLSHL